MSCNRPERCIISEGLGFRVSAAVGGQKHPEKHSKVPNPEAQLRSPCTIRCTTDEAISSRQKGPYHIRSTPHSHENPGMCFAMLLNRLNTWSGTGAFWRVCRDCVDCETSSITALGAGVWLFGISRTHDLQPVASNRTQTPNATSGFGLSAREHVVPPKHAQDLHSQTLNLLRPWNPNPQAPSIRQKPNATCLADFGGRAGRFSTGAVELRARAETTFGAALWAAALQVGSAPSGFCKTGLRVFRVYLNPPSTL